MTCVPKRNISVFSIMLSLFSFCKNLEFILLVLRNVLCKIVYSVLLWPASLDVCWMDNENWRVPMSMQDK